MSGTPPADTTASNPTRELAAIMFSDIVGYTAIMGRDEAHAMRALAEHRALLRTFVAEIQWPDYRRNRRRYDDQFSQRG